MARIASWAALSSTPSRPRPAPPTHLDEFAQLGQPHLLGLGDLADQHQDGVHNGLAREGQSVR